jgi:hypothetical protein
LLGPAERARLATKRRTPGVVAREPTPVAHQAGIVICVWTIAGRRALLKGLEMMP